MKEQAIQIELRQMLLEYFNFNELRSLGLQLNVRLDELSGDNYSAKVEAFIGYMYRRGRLPELIDAAARERPNVTWPVFLPDLTEIPFVVVAMTQTEAETLWENAPNRPALQEIHRTLDELGITNLKACYSTRRDGWTPYGPSQETVREIIEDVIEHLNQNEFANRGLPLLKASLYSEDFFSAQTEKRINTWRKLNQTGCVFVVDPISLLHTDLGQQVLQSQLGAKEEVAMLVISPVDPDTNPANQLIESTIHQKITIPYTRYDQELDRLCEFGIGNLRALKRRLYATLPETASLLTQQRASRSNRDRLRQRMGNPRHIEQVIFRQ